MRKLDLNKKRREQKAKDAIMTIALGIIVAGGSLILSGLQNPNKVEADIRTINIEASINYVTLLHIDASIHVKIEPKCSESFESNNDGLVQPNALTTSQMKDVSDCRDRQILVRLAHYESTQQNICNSLGYCGEWQIGKDAWTDCHNIGITKDAQCALYHFKINAWSRFESVQKNYNSFKDLL